MKLNVVLYNPEIPQNTGNIMRSCVAIGAKLHLIEPLGFSLDEKNLRRAGMDYIQHLDYVIYPNYEDFLSKNSGKFFFSTRYGDKPISKIDFTKVEEDIYIVFGCESKGIPLELLKGNLETCFRFPMTDKVRSLNLSNCVMSACYEVLRQYDYFDLEKYEPENFKGKDFLLK
ncbi:MAG: tRNA (cytidine(34)-2'-O)-methyltransferase [bacterium]